MFFFLESVYVKGFLTQRLVRIAEKHKKYITIYTLRENIFILLAPSTKWAFENDQLH